MSEPLGPRWAEKIEQKPRKCYRVRQADVIRSRARGRRRGNASRWALKNLPPLAEDNEP